MAMKDVFKKFYKDPEFDDDIEPSKEAEQEEDFFQMETPQPKHTEKSSRSEKNEKGGKIVNINATTQLQVVLVKPERFEEGDAVADYIKEGKTIVLNLESTNKDTARRLIDFLAGAAYALEGQIKRVAKSTFIITAHNVRLMGDIIDELENNGVYF